MIVVGLVGAPVVLALPPSPAPYAHAAGTPSVEVWSAPQDGVRVDGVYSKQVAAGQATEVRWKNFTPGSRVVITQCASPLRVKGGAGWGTPGTWPSLAACAHQTRVFGTTKADGTGAVTYPAKVGDLAEVVVSYNGSNNLGSNRFLCNGGTLYGFENMCNVVVSECEWDQPLDLVKPTGSSWTLVPRAPKEGVEEPAVAAASGWLRFRNVDATGAPVDNPKGSPVTTLIPAPPPRKIPAEPEPPALDPITQVPVGKPIQGAGSVNLAHVLDDWLAGVRRLDKPADVDFIRGTSVFGAEQLKVGFDNGFKSGADFAFTGMPLTKEEAGGEVVYAPVSLTALAFANSVEFGGLGLEQIRLSADVVTTLLASVAGDGVGPTEWGNSLGNTPTSVDNHDCGLPVLEAGQVLRSGKSAQSQVLSGWLAAALPAGRFSQAFVSEPGDRELLPRNTANARSAENGSQTAFQIATNFGDAVDPDPKDNYIPPKAVFSKRQTGMVGYVDITEVMAQKAKGTELPVSPLKNAAGKYVTPTKEAILDAYAAMKVNADGTRTPAFGDITRTGMYPLPMLHYIAVPKTDGTGKNPMPIAKRKTLAAFIQYAVSDQAQAKVEELGGARLPDELREQALDVATMLLKADPPKKPGGGGGGNDGGGGGQGGGGNGGNGGGTPAGTTPTGTTPTTSPTPTAPSTPLPGLAMTPVKNEGTVRGGKIPGAKGIVPITIIAVAGGVALLAGGSWRGYLLWRRWSISQVGRR